MDQSKVWGLRRYATLLVVLGLHLALLTVLVMASRTRNISTASNQPVELLFFPPTHSPKIRAENSSPRRSSGDTAITIAPPVLDSPSLPPPTSTADGAASASASDGDGSGVDWAAEAHRAIQAFEIRNHHPSGNISMSGSSAEDKWWPWAQHRAGDRSKTASGDWIVWINSSCYQVTSVGRHAYTLGAALPATICPAQSSTP